MKLIIVSILVFVFIVTSGFHTLAEEWTAEQKEVWKAVETNGELMKKGDLEGVLSLRHNDVLFLWHDKTTTYDKAVLKKEYQDWFNNDKPVTWENRPIAIKIIDNIAIVFYSQKYSGKMFSGSTRIMETWIKQDNKWLILGSIDASCDKLPPCQ